MSNSRRAYPDSSAYFAMLDYGAVSNGETVYSEVMALQESDSVHLHLISSGTVNANFYFETRGSPRPSASEWANEDDGFWFPEPDVTVSGIKGDFDKCSDSLHITNINCPEFRLRIDVIDGGNLGVYATRK